ncbi:unnamed protein product [Eretmochelys imbricata]
MIKNLSCRNNNKSSKSLSESPPKHSVVHSFRQNYSRCCTGKWIKRLIVVFCLHHISELSFNDDILEWVDGLFWKQVCDNKNTGFINSVKQGKCIQWALKTPLPSF